MTTSELLPVIFTVIGVGVALAALTVTVMLAALRAMNQRVVESEARMTKRMDDMEARLEQRMSDMEARLTNRIDSLEVRVSRLEQETSEIKGTLNVIRNALPLRLDA